MQATTAIEVEKPAPQGWCNARLEHISELIFGQSPPSSTYNEEGKGLPFYQGKLEFGPVYPTPRKWCSKPQKIAEKGDILMSIRAPVGPTNICPERSCIGRGLAAIRPLGGIDSLFVLYLMRANETRIAGKGTGTTFSAITSNLLRQFSFLLPPLSEQKRIVSKVEELFTKLDAGVDSLKKAKLQLKRYRQSVLKAAFEGKLPIDGREPKVGPEKWETQTLGHLVSFVGSGITPLGGRNVYVSKGIPFIRSQNVYPDGLRLEDIAYVTEEMHREMDRTHVKPRDVLLNITGASIGRSTVVPETLGEANVNQHVCIIRTLVSLLPSYLSLFLNSPHGQSQIFATQSGVTRQGLNFGQIRRMTVPLPPVEAQKHIIQAIEQIMSLLGKAEVTIQNSLKQSELLRTCTLKQAFQGKLVPQDPNDEPAEKLLVRIKTKRESRVHAAIQQKLQ